MVGPKWAEKVCFLAPTVVKVPLVRRKWGGAILVWLMKGCVSLVADGVGRSTDQELFGLMAVSVKGVLRVSTAIAGTTQAGTAGMVEKRVRREVRMMVLGGCIVDE